MTSGVRIYRKMATSWTNYFGNDRLIQWPRRTTHSTDRVQHYVISAGRATCIMGLQTVLW